MIILQKHTLTATLNLVKGYPTQAHDRGLHSSHIMIVTVLKEILRIFLHQEIVSENLSSKQTVTD
jgi:hypothetical protein